MSSRVRIVSAALAVAIAGGLAATAVSRAETAPLALRYTADGKMEAPKDYRSWIFLTSGHDMAYTEGASAGMHMFDNIFVDRASWAVFQKTGTWPDKTVMVLEARMGEGKGSINKNGNFQTKRVGLEVHVKDTARFKSGWGFFPFNTDAPATALPQTSKCNECHEQHGAVDTTFVQFYPTLLPIAEEKKTFSPAYLAEEAKTKTQ